MTSSIRVRSSSLRSRSRGGGRRPDALRGRAPGADQRRARLDRPSRAPLPLAAGELGLGLAALQAPLPLPFEAARDQPVARDRRRGSAVRRGRPRTARARRPDAAGPSAASWSASSRSAAASAASSPAGVQAARKVVATACVDLHAADAQAVDAPPVDQDACRRSSSRATRCARGSEMRKRRPQRPQTGQTLEQGARPPGPRRRPGAVVGACWRRCAPGWPR